MRKVISISNHKGGVAILINQSKQTSNTSKQKNMRNNFKNIALGLLALIFFGACSSEPKDEVGRYVPIVQNENSSGTQILDTKTGIVYSVYWRDNNIGFFQVNPIKPQAKGAKIPFNLDIKGANYE